MVETRYSRQILAFGETGQQKLERASVGIVGLGGLGSHIAQSLAYLGVRSFILVDGDRIEETNLNRLIGGYPKDLENKPFKVVIAERLIRLIQPDASIIPVAADLRTPSAIENLLQTNIIFGCVDNDGARLILTDLSAAYEITLIDCATEIIPRDNLPLWFGGRIIFARPGEFCLHCAEAIDLEQAKKDLADPIAREISRNHGYGISETSPTPAVVSLNGVIANLAVTEFMAMVTGLREPYKQLHYKANEGKVLVNLDLKKKDCFTCDYLTGKREAANIFRYIKE
jgi:molybdopterin-synthase adenylyltransferase